MKLAPEKSTIPTVSPFSREIRSDISNLARSRRAGFMSWDSILRDISRTTINWTPRCSTISISLPHWGRASAIIISATATNQSESRARRIVRFAPAFNLSTRTGSPIRDTAAARRTDTHLTNTISTGSAARIISICGDSKVNLLQGIFLNMVFESANSSSTSTRAVARNQAMISR